MPALGVRNGGADNAPGDNSKVPDPEEWMPSPRCGSASRAGVADGIVMVTETDSLLS